MKAKNIEDVYELTALQQGLLFHGLYAPADGNYVEQTVLTCAGRLDRDAFWQAWQTVVDRHAALRTTFHWEDIDKPVQAVHAAVQVHRDEVDWRRLPAGQQADALAAALTAERSRGFDLDARPPMRVTLYQIADDAYQICLRSSHLIVDGWSIGVIFSDFAAAYRALAAGRAPELPAPGRFRDYVAWWKRQEASQVEDYWRERLAGYGTPPRLDLGPAPELPGGELPTGWLELPLADIAPAMREFSARHKLTMHTLTQAAWTLVLAGRLSAQDVMVGTTLAHRPADLPAGESIVGCMVVTIPVRSTIDGGRPVLGWMRELQESIASGRDHAGAGLGDFRRWSAVSAGAEMFESSVTFQNMPLPATALAGPDLDVRGIDVDTRPHLPLVLMIMPGDELPMRLVYDRRRFAPGQARLMAEHTREVLTRIVTGPAVTLDDLIALTGPRRQTLVTRPVPPPPAAEPAGSQEPRTETERVLAALLAELLEVPAVGIHDDLVQCGLHSLLGTRAANRIREIWKTPVPLRVLFEQPTVAQLAATIEAGGAVPAPGQPAEVDLNAEVNLAVAITGAAGCPAAAAAGRVVVTGATGYLGAAVAGYLLRNTDARLTCLVRAQSPDAAGRRVRAALAGAGLWQEDFTGRITAIPANLAQPGLGLTGEAFGQLAAEADTIYHLAAVVNVLPPYRKLRAVNVAATREVLRLATTGPLKRVHYVSPAELAHDGAEGALGDEPPLFGNGYVQSKWVAERIAAIGMERGIPLTVYRAARLIGSPRCPYWKLGDVVTELTRACVRLAMVPDVPAGMPVSPVDHVAAAITALSGQAGVEGGYYHVLAAEPVSFDDLAEAIGAAGYPVTRTDLRGWYAGLVRLAQRDQSSGWDLVLAVVGPWVRAARDGWREPDYATQRTQAALGRELPAPRVDAEYLVRCLAQLRETGFIAEPDLALAAG